MHTGKKGDKDMKRLEIIIKQSKLEELLEALDESELTHGVMVSNIQGYGNQRGHVSMYRGAELDVKMLNKTKVETVIEDEKVETTISKIVETIRTGNCGDGKIFVYNVEEAVRIRTGETGLEAL